jgi:hypothetical protein
VTLELANSNPGAAPRLGVAKFTVAARQDQPVLASAALPGDAERSLLLLLKVRRVHSDEDLRSIFQCKMRLRHALDSER